MTGAHSRTCKPWLQPLRSLPEFFAAVSFIFGVSNARAQELPPSQPLIDVEARGTSIRPTQSDTSPGEIRRVALTLNPLNLLIGRYGFNFEFQLVPHHGLIVSPHYDHSSENPSGDYGYAFVDTLNGVGTELGYRFYSGKRSFDGFFAGPSLLIATNRVTSTGSFSGPPVTTSDTWSSVGIAFDVGGQWQLGHFIVGGGAGVRYAKLNQNLNEHGLGDMPVIEEVNAGGGWCPRLALNIGYAF